MQDLRLPAPGERAGNLWYKLATLCKFNRITGHKNWPVISGLLSVTDLEDHLHHGDGNEMLEYRRRALATGACDFNTLCCVHDRPLAFAPLQPSFDHPPGHAFVRCQVARAAGQPDRATLSR